MAEFPALTLWTDAYLSDTRRLTTLEHGAYLLLLIEAWRRPNCDLPDDDRLLARMAGLSVAEWEEIKPIIMEFWKFDGRGKVWKQKRLTKERDAARLRSKSQRDKAAKRWDKSKNDDAAGYAGQSRSDASTATATDIAIKERGNSSSGDDPLPEFELVGGEAEDPNRPLTVDEIMLGWNELADAADLPKVVKLTDARTAQVKARMKDFPELTSWQAAFQTIRSSAFLLGRNDRGWKADFDFLIQAKSFPKLVEGSYGQ